MTRKQWWLTGGAIVAFPILPLAVPAIGALAVWWHFRPKKQVLEPTTEQEEKAPYLGLRFPPSY